MTQNLEPPEPEQFNEGDPSDAKAGLRDGNAAPLRSYLQGLSENLGLLAAFLDPKDTAHPPWRLQATDPQDGLSGRSDAEDEIGEPDETAEWAGDALQVKEAIQAGNAPLIASSLRDAAEILENLQRVLDPDRKNRSVWQLMFKRRRRGRPAQTETLFEETAIRSAMAEALHGSPQKKNAVADVMAKFNVSRPTIMRAMKGQKKP